MAREPTEKQLREDAEYTEKLKDLLLELLHSRDANAALKRRVLHPKSIGFAAAEFRVEANLPEELRVGLFREPKTYKAWVRFSNATAAMDNDADKATRGMAIKLLDVPGLKLSGMSGTEGRRDAEHDFVFNSHPTFPLHTIRDFYELNYHFGKGTILWYFMNPFSPKLGTMARLAAGVGNHVSPLDTRFWSQTPYRLGPNQYVKYSAVPTSNFKSSMPARRTRDYLSEAMDNHLMEHEATFDFMIQLRESDRLSLEDSTVEWTEKKMPFRKVATIHIKKDPARRASENIRERDEIQEKLAFDPWRVLPEHEPVGGINRARRVAYDELASARIDANLKARD